MLRSILLSAILTIVLENAILAAPLSGTVIDEQNQPVANVSVISSVIDNAVQTGEDGQFTVNVVSDFPITLRFSHAGYIPQTITVASRQEIPTVRLVTQVYPMQGITVTAGYAAEGKTPVTYSNIDRSQIARDFDIGEVPQLLEMTPNVYSYSDAGGGLGYSYLSIRGFSPRSTPVYINGVPLNDPEDHALYFVDLPDFASHADNIQVQRGTGNALYGDPAFGGSINILTSPFYRTRQFTAESGYGNFFADGEVVGLMRKSSIFYSTGLLDNGWSLTGRYIQQFSDGYREQSWYDGSAYYLGIGRMDPGLITVLNIYGGPMRTHAAWDGIDRATMYVDRRTNWYSYDNETDNFSQPHFELHNIYSIKGNLTLHNTLYYIRGSGYYEQYKAAENLYDYNLSPDTGLYSDLVRRKWVHKGQGGINSEAEYARGNDLYSFGGSYYHFESEHWGEVIWADSLSPSLNNYSVPGRYYEYFGRYNDFSLFASHNRSITDKLGIMANLQLRYIGKRINHTPVGIFPVTIYDIDWLFLSPRLGVNYTFSGNIRSYFNFSIASHEPNDDMIDDADDPSDRLRLDVIDSTATPILYGDPTVDAERVYDFELGASFDIPRGKIDLNFFWLEFRNEIVPDGQLNNDGFPTYGNADRSIHRGIEASFAYNLIDNLRLGGNVALNDNIIKEYDQQVYDYSGGSSYVVRRSDVTTPNFPKYLANLTFDYSYKSLRGVYYLRAVGRQFVSYDGRFAVIGGEPTDVSIAPVAISSVKLFWNLGDILDDFNLSIEGRVSNIFNQRYETYGYRWGDYFAYWPAAERNWFINFKLTI